MKKLVLFLTVILLDIPVFSQKTKTEIVSDTAIINVLKVMPDSFPNLSILFSAQNQKGFPVWGIKKEQVDITENKQKCNVLSIKQITNETPINIAIIIDHSGSMIADDYLYYSADYIHLHKKEFQRNSPLTKAKKAIFNFLNNFNNNKDKAIIIGFSTEVDLISNFSNDITYLKKQMNYLEEDEKTAFFDAINIGLDSLENKPGINIIVALTDGQDNSSTVRHQNLIKKAKMFEIPIYTIGLGAINKNTLKSLAYSTKGKFFYSKNSESLINVYKEVAKHINSIYEIKYKSNILDFNLENRNVELVFDIDTLSISPTELKYSLPYSYIKAKSDELEQIQDYLYASGISVAVLLSIGVLIYFKKRNKITIT